MITLLSMSVKKCTKDLAADVATMPGCRSERKLKDKRVNWLRSIFDAGEFDPPLWAIAYMGGQRIRVNGQHSSTMLAQLNGHFPHALDVALYEYKVDTEADLAKLFMRFDRPESVRSYMDAFNAHAAIEDGLADISRRTKQIIVGGIALADDPWKTTTTSDDRINLIHFHQEYIKFAAPFVTRRILGRVPVAAAIYKSWRISPTACSEFWNLVSEANHPDNRNASRTLHDALSREMFRRTQDGGERKRYLSAIEMFVKCIRGWNAWRTNQTTLLKVLRADFRNIPELL